MAPKFGIAAIRLAEREVVRPGRLVQRHDGPVLHRRQLLAKHGEHDLDRHSVVPGTKYFIPEFFVD